MSFTRKKDCIFPVAGDLNNHLQLLEEVLIEIFFRSSIESLLRAKCVCKNWYTMIKNPQFVLDHLQYQKAHNKGRLLLQYFKEDTQEYRYALFDDETLVHVTYRDIDHFHLYQYSLRMEGPINGLYCMYNGDDRMMLWNPTLKEFKALPLPHPHSFPHVTDREGHVAFGIDHSNLDYKVVLIRKFFDDTGAQPHIYVTVYNLTTSSWRLLNFDEFHLLDGEYLRQSRNSSFLSGICYWLTSCARIFAFDLGGETFRQILGPDPHCDSLSGSLTIYKDKVTLLQRNDFSVDILAMLDEGIWIKQFSITSLPRFYWDITLWKNDTLLVAIDGFDTIDVNHNFQTVLCNAHTDNRINVGPKGMPLSFHASIYYESLVSVDCKTKYKGDQTTTDAITNFLTSTKNPYLYLDMAEDDFFRHDLDEDKRVY